MTDNTRMYYLAAVSLCPLALFFHVFRRCATLPSVSSVLHADKPWGHNIPFYTVNTHDIYVKFTVIFDNSENMVYIFLFCFDHVVPDV